MVCEAMVCDMGKMQNTILFSVSFDSYYSYVPCFKRENEQESASWHNSAKLETVDSTLQLNNQLQYQQEQRAARLCRNRKRKYYVMDCEQSVEQLKKFRKETMTGFESPKIQEMDWQNDSNTVYSDLNTVNCSTSEQSPSTSTGCYWAAGNSSLISKQDHNHSDGDELNGSNTEYEKLLFTTHGCSVYHHQRAQLLDNRMTTEF